MMEWMKKYWWIIIIGLLILPLLINAGYLFESEYSILHAPSAWATFWATYLSAIASFTMIYFTWRTLKEMQRQWNEQNTPIVSCTLEKTNEYLLLELHNTSQTPAHKVHIELVNNTRDSILRFEETCEQLKLMSFEIPPFSIKQIPIYKTPYVDGEYDGYITVKVSYGNKRESFDLYLKEINLTTWKYTTKDICSKIEHLDATVKSKNFMQ